MMYISSSASNAGLAIIQVYFKQGTDPDMAAVNVQNRVAKAQGLLPAEVTKVGVSTMKRQTSFLQIGALVCTDGRYDQTSWPITWTSMLFRRLNVSREWETSWSWVIRIVCVSG